MLRLRTHDDLNELLKAGKSPAWKIAKWREQRITKVQIFNWDGSVMLQGSFDANKSQRLEDDRLIVGFKDAQLINCNPPLQWLGQNPVHYLDNGIVQH